MIGYSFYTCPLQDFFQQRFVFQRASSRIPKKRSLSYVELPYTEYRNNIDKHYINVTPMNIQHRHASVESSNGVQA